MRDIARWQYQFLGIESVPRNIGELEFTAFFTYSPTELKKLKALLKPDLRLGAALQLGFVKMTGRILNAVKVVPAALLKYIGQQLDVPGPNIASLRAIYQKRLRTLWEHQAWALDVLDFRRPSKRQLKRLLPYLQQQAKYTTSVDQLALLGRVWLYQNKFVVSGHRRILNYARDALAESDQGMVALIQASVTVEQRNQWEAAVLAYRPGTRETYLEWLQQPPRRRSVPSIRQRLERREFLLNLGVDQIHVGDIAQEKLDAFGGQLFNMRPVKYRQLKEPTRTLRLTCFLKMILLQTTDMAIDLGGRMVNQLLNTAFKKARNLEINAAQAANRILAEIYGLEADTSVTDKQFRAKVRESKTQAPPLQFPSRAAATRWQLSEPNPQLRSILSTFGSLDLDADPEQWAHHSFAYLHTLYQQRTTALPKDADIHCPRSWRNLIDGPDRERAMRALEAVTLVGLRRGLRSGSIWTEQSERFRSKDDLLISPARWEQERRSHYIQLNLPMSGEEYMKRLNAKLEAKLEEVAMAVEMGELSIDDGHFHVPKLTAVAPKADVLTAEQALFNQIGVVQLPDIILAMDSSTGFSRMILGRAANTELELLQVYAGMMAHGTALSARGVALMVPQLTPEQILIGMQYFEHKHHVRTANDAVASYIRHLPISAHWGNGSLLSSDMMSLDVSKQVWAARLDHRRRTPSIGTYTHFSDFRAIVHDQPIVLNERQAGAAIDGARYQTEFDVERIAVDTHGFTDYGFGLAKMLRFDLCPRPARLPEWQLYVPRGVNVPARLQGIVNHKVSLRKIIKYYDQLVRRAASVDCGEISATLLLARHGAMAMDDPICRAGVAFGQIVRSIYLCDYLTSEPLRRTINRILVLGESVHQLQRAIYQGSFSKPRGRREVEQIAMSGSLTLMTNLCLAWTATQMQRLLSEAQLKPDSQQDLSWLADVSPARFRNINFRGTITFALENYRDLLIGDGKHALG